MPGSGPCPPSPVASRVTASAVRVSCQTIALCDRSPGPPIPHDGGLALIADADRGDGTGICPGLAQGDPDARPDPFEDLVRRRARPTPAGA